MVFIVGQYILSIWNAECVRAFKLYKVIYLFLEGLCSSGM